MKTCLYTACYLDGLDDSGGDRLVRNLKYVDYYLPLLPILGAERMYFCDNGSDIERVSHLEKHSPHITILRYEDHLPRKGIINYPYLWRALKTIHMLLRHYDKIICIDSDLFVLSERLLKHLSDLNTGWEVFWCPKHKFPEAALSVLCKDTFPIFEAFMRLPYQIYDGFLFETTVPYTKVNTDFIGDRYGEYPVFPSLVDSDFSAQTPVSLPMSPHFLQPGSDQTP